MNEQYLEQGSQTRFTDRVYEHAENARRTVMNNPRIESLPEPRISIRKTCKYISQLPLITGFIPQERTREEVESNRRLKNSVSRQRDIDQILREGYFPTCSDIGLLFRGLMAAQGHPTAFVETFHEDYLFDRNFHGHVFGRVFDGNDSLIVNPTQDPTIVDEEFKIFPYIIFREGLDSWDIGISRYEDMHRLKRENIRGLLERYERSLRTAFQEKVNDLQELRSRLSLNR